MGLKVANKPLAATTCSMLLWASSNVAITTASRPADSRSASEILLQQRVVALDVRF